MDKVNKVADLLSGVPVEKYEVVMTFGKHVGTAVGDLDEGYLTFLDEWLETISGHAVLREAVKEELRIRANSEAPQKRMSFEQRLKIPPAKF